LSVAVVVFVIADFESGELFAAARGPAPLVALLCAVFALALVAIGVGAGKARSLELFIDLSVAIVVFIVADFGAGGARRLDIEIG
jgi:hypothetical protein